jgi:hypothetical protein
MSRKSDESKEQNMTVKELITILQSKPPDLPVAYEIYSEYCLLEADRITIKSLCAPREDGWVHDKRPDKPSQDYLVFPGN